MAHTWQEILRNAIGDRKIKHVYEATIDDPEGPVQRATISAGLNGKEPDPPDRVLRVLCRTLDLDESAIRADLRRPPDLGLYTGPASSRYLDQYQRELIDRLITQLVAARRAEFTGNASDGRS